MSVVQTGKTTSVWASNEYAAWGLGAVGRKNRKEQTPRAVAFRSDFGVTLEGALKGAARYGREVRLKGRENEAYTIIHSFSAEEFDKDDPEHRKRVADLSYELADRVHPHSKKSVFVHADADGGHLHSHIIILNEDESTGGSIQEGKQHSVVMRHNDRLMRENGLQVAKKGRKTSKHTMYALRAIERAEKKLAQLREAPQTPKRDKEIQKLEERLEKERGVIGAEAAMYEALNEVFEKYRFTSLEEFAEVCSQEGVTVTFRELKSGKRIRYSYEYVDEQGNVSKVHNRREDGLAVSYSQETVQEFIDFYQGEEKENVDESSRNIEEETGRIREIQEQLSRTDGEHAGLARSAGRSGAGDEAGDDRAAERAAAVLRELRGTQAGLEQLAGDTARAIEDYERASRKREEAARAVEQQQDRTATERANRQAERPRFVEAQPASAEEDYELG